MLRRSFSAVSCLATLPSPLPAHPVQLSSLAPLPARASWFTPLNALDLSYFAAHPDPLVPLELTTTSSFSRLPDVPLSYFLQYLQHPPPPSESNESLYLAQFDPPPFLKGDVALLSDLLPAGASLSHSSLWLGLAPTVTPFHNDPDDNVLYQIKGRKRVRLLPPALGETVLARIRKGGGVRLRGEEMMRPGPEGERDALEAEVWGRDYKEGVEAVLQEGEALFIPRRWWHAVRGEATGDDRVNASVNWWFR